MSRGPPWPCFGIRWDEESTECAGGFDLAYTNPTTKSNLTKRPRCQAFDACRAKKQQGSVVNYSPLLPPQHLIRPGQRDPPQPPPAVPPPVNAPPYAPYGRQAAPLPLQQPQQPQQYYQPSQPPQQLYQQPQVPVLYAPPYAAQYGPTAVPVQHQAYGAHMPAYLAVPEPVGSAGWLSRLAAESVRSMAKAFGHSLASFIDHNPFRLHVPPQQATYVQPPPQAPPASNDRT